MRRFFVLALLVASGPSFGAIAAKNCSYTLDTEAAHYPDHLYDICEGSGPTLDDKGSGTPVDLTHTADWASDATHGNSLDFVQANSDEAVGAVSSLSGTLTMCVIADGSAGTNRRTYGGFTDDSQFDRLAALALEADEDIAALANFDGSLETFIHPTTPDLSFQMQCTRVSDSSIDTSLDGGAWTTNAITNTGMVAAFNNFALGVRNVGTPANHFDDRIIAAWWYEGSKSDAEISTIYNSGDPWPQIGMSDGDATAPTCSAAPTEHSDTDTTVTVDATCSDETDATVDHYWAVTANDATDPTAEELRTDTYGGTFIDRDASDAGVSNGVESQVTLTGLSASTSYDVFHTVCDSSDNCKTVVQVDITTDATALACTVTDSSPTADGSTEIDCTGGTGGNIASIDSPEGDTFTVDGGASATVSFSLDDWVPAGDGSATEWDASGTWVVSNGTETANVTMEIDPPDVDQFGQVVTPLADDGSNIFPSGADDGDDYYNDVLTGTGVETLANGSVSSSSAEASGEVYIFDDSAGEWLAVTAWESGEPDETAPTLQSVAVNAAGTSLTLTFNEAVVVGSGGNGGFALTATLGSASLTYSSGDGSTELVYTVGRTINAGETLTLDYTQPGDGIEDTAGNDLVSFSDTSVTNNSTQDTVAPLVARATIEDAVLTIRYTEVVEIGAGGNGGHTLDCTGGAVTPSYSSGDGTLALVYTLSRTVAANEVCTLDYTQPTDGIEDAAGNDLATYSDQAVLTSACTNDAIYEATQDATGNATGDRLCVGF